MPDSNQDCMRFDWIDLLRIHSIPHQHLHKPRNSWTQCLDCMFLQHKQSGSFGLCQKHSSLHRHRHTRIDLCLLDTFPQHKQSGSFGLCQKHSSLHKHLHKPRNSWDPVFWIVCSCSTSSLAGLAGGWHVISSVGIVTRGLTCACLIRFPQHKQSGSFGLCQKHSSLHQQHHRMFDRRMLDSNQDCMQSHSSDQQMTRNIPAKHP